MALMIRKFASPLFTHAHLLDEMSRYNNWWEGATTTEFATDLYETDQAVHVEVAVPGFKPEDIQINVTGDLLSIAGQKSEENEKIERTYHQKEIHYGKFTQSFTLPSLVQADKAEAHFVHGVLKIELPKVEEAKPKQIQIKSQDSGEEQSQIKAA